MVQIHALQIYPVTNNLTPGRIGKVAAKSKAVLTNRNGPNLTQNNHPPPLKLWRTKKGNMHIDSMKTSKFLASGDVREKPLLLTMTKLHKENVAMEGAEPDNKWCLGFVEVEKPMVLNATNIQLIGAIHGPETDNWPGKKIVLYHDPNISYGGKLIGGLRVRAPKTTTVPAPPQPVVSSQPAPDDDDSVPF
jgi:hypothetical protein